MDVPLKRWRMQVREVDGTIIFFNEAEAVYNPEALEPEQLEEPVSHPVMKKGKKDQDLSGFLQNVSIIT